MLEAVVSLVVATMLLLGSPGPVPIALAASSGVFGLRRSVPFLLGVLSGLAVAITLGSAGIVTLFSAFPASRLILGICGGIYICYVAFKIAKAPLLVNEAEPDQSLPSFRDGFLLNLLNPKAYAAFLALFSQFLLPLSTNLVSIVVTALIAFAVAVAVDVAWLMLGGVLAPVFSSPKLARPTRVVFGVMMVGAVAFAFLSS